MSGYFKTAILLAGLTALFMAVGAMIGGEAGMMIALLFAINLAALLSLNWRLALFSVIVVPVVVLVCSPKVVFDSSFAV